MTYTFECDRCGNDYEQLPAFMGEVRERWFKTTELGGLLADAGYTPASTVTICGPCIYESIAEGSRA